MRFYNAESQNGVLNNGSVVSVVSVEPVKDSTEAPKETPKETPEEKKRREQIPTKKVIKAFVQLGFDTDKVDKSFKVKSMARQRLRSLFASEVPETHKVQVEVVYDDGTTELVDATRAKRDKDGNTIYKANPKGVERQKKFLATIKAKAPKLLPKAEEAIKELFSDMRQGRGELDFDSICADLEFDLV